MSGPIQSCVVIGDRCTASLVAATLAAQMPPSLAIDVVEVANAVEDTWIFPLGDALLADLGIAPRDLIDADADLVLGQVLDGFLGDAGQVVAARSGDLPAIGSLPLHQILHCLAEKAGALTRFAEHYAGFRLGARAAQGGRMALPEDAPDSPLAMLAPLVRIEAGTFATLLANQSDPGRIDHHRSASLSFDRAGDGSITAVLLAGGAALPADLVIDLRPEVVDEGDGVSVAMPLLDAAAALGVDAYEGPQGLPGYRIASEAARPGAHRYLTAPWTGNHLKMGPGSARFGVLFGLAAPYLFAQIRTLAECFPASGDMQTEARRFNQTQARMAERFHEIAAAPIHLNRQKDPAWRALRAIAAPDGLSLRIERFASRGDMPGLEGEVVDRQFWIDLLLDLGVVPARHDRRAEGFEPRQLDAALGTIRGQIDAALRAMPSRSAFMARYRDS